MMVMAPWHLHKTIRADFTFLRIRKRNGQVVNSCQVITNPLHPQEKIEIDFTFLSIRKQNGKSMTIGEPLARSLQILYIRTR